MLCIIRFEIFPKIVIKSVLFSILLMSSRICDTHWLCTESIWEKDLLQGERNLDRYIVMLNILKIKTLQIYCPWIFRLIEKTQSSAFNLFILICPFSSIIRYSKNTPRFKQFSFNKLKSQDFSLPSLILVTGLYSSIPV